MRSSESHERDRAVEQTLVKAREAMFRIALYHILYSQSTLKGHLQTPLWSSAGPYSLCMWSPVDRRTVPNLYRSRANLPDTSCTTVPREHLPQTPLKYRNEGSSRRVHIRSASVSVEANASRFSAVTWYSRLF